MVARSASGFVARSVPFHNTRPSVALVIVARILMSVVLPAPFGPSRPSTPGPSCSEKPRRAQFPPPYRVLTFSMVSRTPPPPEKLLAVHYPIGETYNTQQKFRCAFASCHPDSGVSRRRDRA